MGLGRKLYFSPRVFIDSSCNGVFWEFPVFFGFFFWCNVFAWCFLGNFPYIIKVFLRYFVVVIFFRFSGLFRWAPLTVWETSRESGWLFLGTGIGRYSMSSAFSEYSGGLSSNGLGPNFVFQHWERVDHHTLWALDRFCQSVSRTKMSTNGACVAKFRKQMRCSNCVFLVPRLLTMSLLLGSTFSTLYSVCHLHYRRRGIFVEGMSVLEFKI